MAGAATEGIWWQAQLCQVETLLPPRCAGVEGGSHSLVSCSACRAQHKAGRENESDPSAGSSKIFFGTSLTHLTYIYSVVQENLSINHLHWGYKPAHSYPALHICQQHLHHLLPITILIVWKSNLLGRTSCILALQSTRLQYCSPACCALKLWREQRLCL